MSNNNDAAITLLEKHFDIAFTAFNGIKKLRELILSLAIQGKLVSQLSSDQPASELLKEIQKEKERLVKEGKIKPSKPLPKIKPDEVPYDLPNSWKWVRFGEITINKDGERIPIAKENRQKIQGKYDYYGASGVIDKVNNFLFDKSLLLIGEDGANLINRSTPIAFIAHGKYWVNNHAHVLDTIHFDLLLYLEKYINAIDLKPYVTGTAQPKMNQAKMHSIVIGLPPLAEQRRIVAKIDELMARCDELEKLRSDRNHKQITVHTAALNRLLIAKEQSSFNTAWQFITQHFGELYSVKENVSELRKAILQLAVMGRLVPQDPNDQPASELLKAIISERNRLMKEGRIKDQKLLGDIKVEEITYKLPKSWQWVRLGQLLPEYQNGISKRNSDEGSEKVVIRLADIKFGEVSLDDPRLIRLTDEEFKRYELTKNDILITRVNGSTDLIGNFTLIKSSDSLTYCDHFIRLRVFQNFITSIYLCKVAKSSILREQISSKFITTAGQKTVNQNHISSLVFPLPPLAEQHRIVTKIDQLMALCDNLEKQIDNANSKQTNLLNAVMTNI